VVVLGATFIKRIEVTKNLLAQREALGKFVLGTAKGDIHDIWQEPGRQRSFRQRIPDI
jgi:methanogenic corrinoid protein MtbC1